MFGHSPIESNRDRKVKVYLDNNSVSASTAQSEYARFLNFIGDRFTAVSNTVGGVKTYDIALKYADKIIPYEESVAKGSTPGYLNFEGDHFDVSSLASNMYTVTSTGWVKVNSFTVKPLNIVNATNNEAVTAAEGASTIDLTFNNDEVAVYSNGTIVNAAPGALNFSTDFTATHDSGNDRFNIALAGANYLPDPTAGQYGILRWGNDDAPSLEGIFAFGDVNDVGDGTRDQNDDADGLYVDWETGSDDNDYIEFTTNGANITGFTTRRDYNPHLYGKIKMVGTSFRMFIGFHNNDPLTLDSNTPIGSNSGFGFSYSTDVPDTNYKIRRNDGSGSEVSTDTGVAFASGTAVTFHIWGNSSGWFWSINGGTASAAITTDVPAAATRMYITCRVEEIGGTEQTMQVYYIYYKSDK